MEDFKQESANQFFVGFFHILCTAILLAAAIASAQEPYPPWQKDEIVVNHSIDKAAGLLASCENYDDFIPQIKFSRKLSSNQCYLESSILNELFWMHVQTEKRESYDKKIVYISSREIAGNVDVFEAKAMLSSIEENKTRIVLEMKADIGLPKVADSLVQSYVRKTIRKTLINLNTQLILGRF